MLKENRILYTVLSPVILFVLWEGLSRAGVISSEILPPFTTSSTVHANSWLQKNSRTPARFILPMGHRVLDQLDLVHSHRNLYGQVKTPLQFFDPLLTLTYPVPKAAMIPILMLWMGAGDLPK